jgi:hypothetical protein
MSELRPLPRHHSDEWRGGFVIDSPTYTTCIAARDGLVVAGADRIYRLRPGVTAFQSREVREDGGAIACVAVEPRRLHGKPARFAVGTLPRTLQIMDEKGIAKVTFPEDHGEILEMMWAPRGVGGDASVCLHVLCSDVLLRHIPGGGPMGTFEQVDSPAPDICAMATDGVRSTALAVYDEEEDSVIVYVLKDARTSTWSFQKLPVPLDWFGVHLAVAGRAVAVSFIGTGGIWLTREIEEKEFVELEQLRGYTRREDGIGDTEGAIAFEGPQADAALFAAVRDSAQGASIVRVDAEGGSQRIAELTVEGDAETRDRTLIHQMAWDATRRTVWSAAGLAGVLCSTAPGAPVPMGDKAGERALS